MFFPEGQIERVRGRAVDHGLVAATRQQLVDRRHGAEHGGRVLVDQRVLEAVLQLPQREDRSAVGWRDKHDFLDMARAGPGRGRRAIGTRQRRTAVAQEVTRQQTAHRVGDDVEFDVGTAGCSAVAAAMLGANLGALFLDELVQQAGILRQRAAPVVGELEAGVVFAAIVDGAGFAEPFVAIAAGAERLEDGGVGLGLDLGNAEQRHIVAALALGAVGVWIGTAWLVTKESHTDPLVLAKLLKAGSEDTVITRAKSGKTNRQLRTAYTEEWAAPDAPEPLKMPFHDILVGDLLGAIDRHQVEPLMGSGTGQGIAWFDEELTTDDVMNRLLSEAQTSLNRIPGVVPRGRGRNTPIRQQRSCEIFFTAEIL